MAEKKDNSKIQCPYGMPKGWAKMENGLTMPKPRKPIKSEAIKKSHK